MPESAFVADNHAVCNDGFVLSCPETDQNIVNAMHARYLELSDRPSVKSTVVDRELFGDFITDSFKEICQHNKCELVIFTIKEKSGRIDISALPAAE